MTADDPKPVRPYVEDVIYTARKIFLAWASNAGRSVPPGDLAAEAYAAAEAFEIMAAYALARRRKENEAK